MSLPSVIGRGSVEIGGVPVEYHSLSRAEVFDFFQAGGVEAAEVFALVKGTDSTEEEIKTWRETSDLESVGLLVDAIMLISGLATQKQIDTANAKRHGDEPEEGKPEDPS